MSESLPSPALGAFPRECKTEIFSLCTSECNSVLLYPNQHAPGPVPGLVCEEVERTAWQEAIAFQVWSQQLLVTGPVSWNYRLSRATHQRKL